MRLFYNKKTKQIVGTVDGFQPISDNVRIVPGGLDPDDIGYEDIELGSEKEELARKLMDPHTPLGIDMVEFSAKDGVREVSDAKKEKVVKKRQENAKRFEERLQKLSGSL